jgi:hypothetical protein
MKKLRIGVFQNLPVGGAYRVFAEEVSFLSKHHELYGYSLSEHEWFIPVQRRFSRTSAKFYEQSNAGINFVHNQHNNFFNANW